MPSGYRIRLAIKASNAFAVRDPAAGILARRSSREYVICDQSQFHLASSLVSLHSLGFLIRFISALDQHKIIRISAALPTTMRTDSGCSLLLNCPRTRSNTDCFTMSSFITHNCIGQYFDLSQHLSRHRLFQDKGQYGDRAENFLQWRSDGDRFRPFSDVNTGCARLR